MKRICLSLVATLMLALPFGAAQTIADLAAGTPELSTLVDLLTQAGLVETFADAEGGPYTVFAPTNAAFEALPAGTLEMLGADPDLLTEVLTYHVVPEAVMAMVPEAAEGEDPMATALSDGMVLDNLEGGELTVSINGGTVMVDGATVVMADIAADNGVVHVIDSVIVPPLLGLEKRGAIRYTVSDVAGIGADGVVVIKGNRKRSTVSVLLRNTPEGGVHPMHFHTGDCGSGGDVVIPLNNLDGTTGTSRTIVQVPYGVIVGGDHYLNVHLAPDDLGTIVACGEVGTGAMGY